MVYEKVIDEIDTLRKRINQESQTVNDDLVDVLEDLKKGWWTPVEDEVPRIDVPVLLSVKSKNPKDKGIVIIGINHHGTWCAVTFKTNGPSPKPWTITNEALSGVRAWMPLPDTYDEARPEKHPINKTKR